MVSMPCHKTLLLVAGHSEIDREHFLNNRFIKQNNVKECHSTNLFIKNHLDLLGPVYCLVLEPTERHGFMYACAIPFVLLCFGRFRILRFI